MGFAESCGHVPIDPTDVVAWLIGTNFSGFRTVTRSQSAMVTLEESVESTSHTDFKATQNLCGGRSIY
jgi:hypothetical protein